MSIWSYIHGTITVCPLGKTQPEKRYILDTVLAHLPKVTGSERDMNVYVIQKEGYDTSCSHDEFGQYSNLGNSGWPGDHPSFETQSEYIIVVDASLRDREFLTAFREFQNWLCRLSKRVRVEDVLVEISSYNKHTIIRSNSYTEMFEEPSWCNEDGAPTWSEYMMYDSVKNSEFPMLLAYKYFEDDENDKEVEHRLNFTKGL